MSEEIKELLEGVFGRGEFDESPDDDAACIPYDTLLAFVRQELAPLDAKRVRAHLMLCDQCKRIVGGIVVSLRDSSKDDEVSEVPGPRWEEIRKKLSEIGAITEDSSAHAYETDSCQSEGHLVQPCEEPHKISSGLRKRLRQILKRSGEHEASEAIQDSSIDGRIMPPTRQETIQAQPHFSAPGPLGDTPVVQVVTDKDLRNVFVLRYYVDVDSGIPYVEIVLAKVGDYAEDTNCRLAVVDGNGNTVYSAKGCVRGSIRFPLEQISDASSPLTLVVE